MKKLLLPLFLVAGGTTSAQFITNNGIAIANTSVVSTTGDWANQGAIRNDGTIITTDNFVNTGTLDAASTGGFVLRFAANKSFTPGGTNFGFLVKEGAGNADITGQFSLKDSLAIKGGLIKPLTAADVLTVSETGIVTSAPGSFLDGGNLVRRGTGRLFFPVGKNGNALPITFVNVSGANPSITVKVEDAPTGFTAGAGVNALIDFPYVWKTTKTNVSDSTFVEIEYPNTLPNAADVVVVRKLTGQNRYEGMGARLITNAGGVVRVRSYSRGAQGTFSIARGFRGNLKTDSLALLALYQSTGGPAWINRTNWASPTARVGTWQGVTETGGQITALSLPNNRLVGRVPEAFADMAALQTINLSANELTRFPNMTGSTGITSLNLSNNKLGFGSLLPNISITGLTYVNQALIDSPFTSLPDVGTDVKIKAITDGTGNVYGWKRNGAVVAGASDSTYTITAINRSNMGDYEAEITNPGVPNLTLKTAVKRILAQATISGRVFDEGTSPVTNGQVLLFKITTSGGYDTLATMPAISATGNYSARVTLDDYLILANADVTSFPNNLPTYYKNTIFWEEANRVVVEGNQSGLDIAMQKRPVEQPKGQGVISGFLEDRQAGGRVRANERIAKAGASVRRRTRVARPNEDKLTLVGYIFTNDNGEFEFVNLENGEYLLNLQYPGYPMDPNSFINITIGPGLDRRISVEALIQRDQITVNKLVVTGWDEEDKRFSVYPNPTAFLLNISVNEEWEGLSYMITDATGKAIQSGNLASRADTAIDVTGLAAGVYQVRIADGSRAIKTFRIVIKP